MLGGGPEGAGGSGSSESESAAAGAAATGVEGAEALEVAEETGCTASVESGCSSAAAASPGSWLWTRWRAKNLFILPNPKCAAWPLVPDEADSVGDGGTSAIDSPAEADGGGGGGGGGAEEAAAPGGGGGGGAFLREDPLSEILDARVSDR